MFNIHIHVTDSLKFLVDMMQEIFGFMLIAKIQYKENKVLSEVVTSVELYFVAVLKPTLKSQQHSGVRYDL